jgi:beta-lactamase class A
MLITGESMDKAILQQEINQEIEKAVNDHAKVSLYIKELDQEDELYSYHKEDQVISASVIKVAIMLAALDQVKKELLSIHTLIDVPINVILDDSSVFEYGSGTYTLDELLTWMIINSDNTATNVLIDFLTMDCINGYCKTLNLKNTKLERKMLDFEAVKLGCNNYTSAEDMRVIYSALYHHAILTPALCDFGISILKRQRDKKLSMRYIYDDITVAHKTGGLDFLHHDAGIFYLDQAVYYFGAFMSEAPSDDYAKRWIGRISKLVYEYYKQRR